MIFARDLITDWMWPEGGNPKPYGLLHIFSLLFMVILIYLFVTKLALKYNKKTDDKVVFGIGLFLIIIEIYKQIFNTLVSTNGYQWYMFPFQFCSVPMYIAIISSLLKEGKVKDAMYKFLAYYGLVAGTAVMLIPGDVFTSPYAVISFHSMLWHISLVVMGCYLLISRRLGFEFKKDIVPAFIVFVSVVTLAIIFNIIGYNAFFGNSEINVHGHMMNLFFISPYYITTLPVLSLIQPRVPYPIFLLCYLVMFTLGVSLVWLVNNFIRKSIIKKELHGENNKLI